MKLRVTAIAAGVLAAATVAALASAGVVASASAAARSKVTLTKPKTPASVAINTSFSTSGYVKPRVGGKTKLYYYRHHQGAWRLYTTRLVSNKKYKSYTRYGLTSSIPYNGSWRVKAYFKGDKSHTSGWSSQRTFTVTGASSGQPSIACASSCH